MAQFEQISSLHLTNIILLSQLLVGWCGGCEPGCTARKWESERAVTCLLQQLMHAIVMVHKMQRLALSSTNMEVDTPPSCPPIAEEAETRGLEEEEAMGQPGQLPTPPATTRALPHPCHILPCLTQLLYPQLTQPPYTYTVATR